MATSNDIFAHLERLAPPESALPNDPVGLLIGGGSLEIGKIGVCLDATPEVARQAVADSVHLLIAHHPLIYHPLKRLDAASDPVAHAVTILVKADITLYAMHTNWDAASGGINDTLAEMLGLRNVRPLGGRNEGALPRLGETAKPLPFADFAHHVETALGCAGTSALRVNGVAADRIISRVGVCGGAGASLAKAVQAAGADAYVTSDVRHHEFLDAAGRGLALIDAGHAATETPGMRALVPLIIEGLPDVKVIWLDGTGESARMR
jgi:dinuclear metal center YbgI/SA1388 family protein